MKLLRWSRWTDQGMVEFGKMSLEKIQENLERFDAEAWKMLYETGADHVLYARKLYDENWELEEVRFYMIPMSDKEFEERTASKNNQRVFAVHKMK